MSHAWTMSFYTLELDKLPSLALGEGKVKFESTRRDVENTPQADVTRFSECGRGAGKNRSALHAIACR